MMDFFLRASRAFPLAALLLLAGCFSERSFPIRPHDATPLSAADAALPNTTREWLEVADERLEPLLPAGSPEPLRTSDLVDSRGAAIDVLAHFHRDPTQLSSLLFNWAGLLCTAQVTSERFSTQGAPYWPHFEDVWVPINENLKLAGRLGLARRGGRPVAADCIILSAGLFGDNATLRSRDVAAALLRAGYHVLALEPRAHGLTEGHYPDTPYTFGTLEAGDLLAVDEWLQRRPEVLETGLVGFCWSANVALIAAWEDGRRDDDPDVAPRLRGYLRPRSGQRHFRAGILAFSPAIDFESLLKRLDRRWPMWLDPVGEGLNRIVDGRVQLKSYPDLNGSLRRLCLLEAERAFPGYTNIEVEGGRYLRLLPQPGERKKNKLDAARVPVLVVHAVDDPVGSADDIAGLMSQVHNPNVAALVMPGGGHCGFAAYSREYFYSLMLNFFDRQRGAAAAVNRAYARQEQARGARHAGDVNAGDAKAPQTYWTLMSR